MILKYSEGMITDMDLITWQLLGTYTGAAGAVLLITQLTKNIPFIKKIPTNLWSFIVAIAVLFPAKYFTGELTLSEAALIPFNCVIIAFASSGGFDTLNKAFPNIFKKSNDADKNEDNKN